MWPHWLSVRLSAREIFNLRCWRLNVSQWCGAGQTPVRGGGLRFGWVTVREKTSCGPTRGCLWSYSYVTQTQTVVGSRQREDVLAPVWFLAFLHYLQEACSRADNAWITLWINYSDYRSVCSVQSEQSADYLYISNVVALTEFTSTKFFSD